MAVWTAYRLQEIDLHYIQIKSLLILVILKSKFKRVKKFLNLNFL